MIDGQDKLIALCLEQLTKRDDEVFKLFFLFVAEVFFDSLILKCSLNLDRLNIPIENCLSTVFPRVLNRFIENNPDEIGQGFWRRSARVHAALVLDVCFHL